MRRIGLAARVLVVVVAVATRVSADAPSSGPDQQYDNFDSRDKIISDRFTGLVWDRPAAPYPAPMTFAQAKAYCTGTMRLPSLKELLTLVDESPHQEYDESVGANVARLIDRSAFPKTPAAQFWTSSMKGSEVWTVDFADGATRSALPGDSRRVRCVDYVAP